MTDPTQDYFAKLKALRSQQQPNSTYDDISKRASELSMLMPKTQTRGLYGLASDLSRGLVQQAASGRPSSIGYGLAAGFNLYSEAAQQRQEKVEEMRSKLMQMAYTDLEKKRADSKDLQEKMLDANFKYQLQALKETGGVFEGKNLEAQMFNLLLAAEKDPTIKLKPEYKLALKYVTEPRRTPVQTESGTQIIESPGLDVSDIFGPAPDEAPPEGATFTGRYNAADGKKIFQRPGPTGAMEYFTKD
jgi:hypothetical protein|tara:strand:- start:2793 stop:3530 length:738 start_codon:yes stop_codon:yes gene_type:complete